MLVDGGPETFGLEPPNDLSGIVDHLVADWQHAQPVRARATREVSREVLD